MSYKNFLLIIFLLLLTNCTAGNLNTNKANINLDINFRNKGFTLIYDDNLYDKKVITKKINERSLTIFQKNLKKNTQVKITNILNNKYIIATVGGKSNYPSFNNSVISERIAKELDLNIGEPYVEIVAIPMNSIFIAKKAKTYDEEKNVANKVPVNSVSINDLNNKKIEKKNISNNRFSYEIKIADFYFNDTTIKMMQRIKIETKVKNPKIKKISTKKYRVYIGPFNNINALQNSYNDINILGFENIEFIKND